jgi:hypothetical protein
MSKTNKKKSESDYKCCKLEIYKLTPSFRNSRLSSSERLCWVVWYITRSFTLIYTYPVFFILKYLLCHKWRKVQNFLHYYVWHNPSSKWHTDTVFVQIPTFVFCFIFCLFVFSILANLYINFETGKMPAHERNNFIFHVYICISVILSCFINADIEYWRPSISYSTKILSSNEQTC